jgi:hypothetical protein
VVKRAGVEWPFRLGEGAPSASGRVMIGKTFGGRRGGRRTRRRGRHGGRDGGRSSS